MLHEYMWLETCLARTYNDVLTKLSTERLLIRLSENYLPESMSSQL